MSMIEFRPDPWWWSILLTILAALSLFGCVTYVVVEQPRLWSALAPVAVAAALSYGAWSSHLRIRVYLDKEAQLLCIERMRWPQLRQVLRQPLSEILSIEVEDSSSRTSQQFGIELKRRSGPPLEISPLGTRKRAYYDKLCEEMSKLIGYQSAAR